MSVVRGIYRALGFALLLILVAIGIILTGWWPFQLRGIRFGTWSVHLGAKYLMKLMNVNFTVENEEELVNY